jgi:hypothetical protein
VLANYAPRRRVCELSNCEPHCTAARLPRCYSNPAARPRQRETADSDRGEPPVGQYAERPDLTSGQRITYRVSSRWFRSAGGWSAPDAAPSVPTPDPIGLSGKGLRHAVLAMMSLMIGAAGALSR